MIVDGKAIASEILAEVRASLAGRVPIVRAVVVSPSAATESYLSIKQVRAKEAGMTLEVVRATTEAEVIAAVQEEGPDAVIVQLPLPDGFDTKKVLDAIPPQKDADVLSSAAYARFESGESGALTPPVAAAVLEILARTSVEVDGKNVVVVGTGRLVGKPVATALTQARAHVTTVTAGTPSKEDLYRSADIIVTGAGAAHVITPEVIKDGVVLVDAGTSESDGAISGDVDPACADKASVFTPVPGGVGPVAVAMLFRNVITLFKDR